MSSETAGAREEDPSNPLLKLDAAAPDVGPGVTKAALQFGSGLTTPENLLLMAGTGGLGALEKQLGKSLVTRLVSAGFSGQMLKSAYDQVPALREHWNKQDWPNVRADLTRITLSGGMAGLAATHAAKGPKETTNVPTEEKPGQSAEHEAASPQARPIAAAGQPARPAERGNQPAAVDAGTAGHPAAQTEVTHAGDDARNQGAPGPAPRGRATGGTPPAVREGDGQQPIPGLPRPGGGGPGDGEPQSHPGSVGENTRRVTGSADLPLTKQGERHAAKIDVDPDTQVFHAPNRRSEQTGQIASDRAKPAAWLEPWRLGEHEGKPLPGAQPIIDDLMRNPDKKPGVSPHSGEAGESFRTARDRLITGAARQRAGIEPGDKVLNVTSGRAIAIAGGHPEQEIATGQLYQWTPQGMKAVEAVEPGKQHFITHEDTIWNPSPDSSGDGKGRGIAPRVVVGDASMGPPPPQESVTPRGPGFIGNIPTSEIHADPVRFQFKQNVGQGGAGETFRDVTKWDPEMGGTVSVWLDPADGKTYVVNGHHRLEMAQRLGVPELSVRYLKAATAQEARLKGAIINIAEASQTASSIDAAKVFRDSGMTEEEIAADGRIAMKGKLAKEGFALSKLAQPIFDDVTAGELTPARGAVIGAGVPNHADQIALYDIVRKMERGGKRLTNDQLEELIRMNSRAPKITESTADQAQASMFGEEEMTRSLLPEKAIVSDYVRSQLKAERKLFGAVSSQAAAERLGEAGNVIQTSTNAAKAEGANQGISLYDKLSTSAGPIDGILDRAAQRLANGENANDAKEQAYRETRDYLAQQIRQLSGIPEGDARRVSGSLPAGDSEARAGQHDQAPVVEPQPAPAAESPKSDLERQVEAARAEHDKLVEAAKARLKARKKRLERGSFSQRDSEAGQGLFSKQDFDDMVLVAGDYIHRAGDAFVEYVKAMVAEYGDTVRPLLRKAYLAAKTRAQAQDDLFAERPAAPEPGGFTPEALLHDRLTAQMKSGGRVKASKLKAAQSRSLFDEEGPESGNLFAAEDLPRAERESLSLFAGDERGSFSFKAKSGGGVADSFLRADLKAVKELKAKRDAGLAAVKKAAADPAEKAFGQRLVEYYTGERDMWVTRVNQVLDRLKALVPGAVERQGIAIYRDFKTRPGELQQWLNGTHVNLRTLSGADLKTAMDRIQELRPAILQALHPTKRMLDADKVLTTIAEASFAEGHRLGFIPRELNSERYFTHLLFPKGEAPVPVPIGERMGKALGGKIGREYAFSARREYPTVLDAIADNVKPKTLDPFVAFAIHGDAFATARATHLLIEALRRPGVGGYANGAAKWFAGSDRRIPEGWVAAARHSRLFSQDGEYVDPVTGEKVLAEQQLYVPKVIDQALRPITDPDYMNRLPGFAQLRHTQAYLKAVQLGLSFFHVTTENYMALANMGPKGWWQGLRADRDSADFLKAEREFIGHGGTTSVLGRTVEAYKALEPGLIPTWGDIWKSAPVVREVDHLAGKITEFTFGKIQRQFKVTDYGLHKAAWLADHPNATQMETRAAMGSISKEINAVYGGLNWENLGINHMSVEVTRALLLAPDWTISNVFNLKYSFERGTEAGKLARMFWIRQLVGGIALTEATSLMLGGRLSKDPTQVYMGHDKDGKDIYQNVFFKGAGGDVVNFVHDTLDYGGVQGPIRFMAGKGAPFIRTGMELANNEDFLHRELIPKGMNPVASTARGLWEAAKGVAPTPLTLTNWKDMLIGPKADQYSVPEFLTVPFAGTAPRHVPSGGMRMRHGELEEYEPPANRSIWDEIVSGKR
jgi:broad specificity phosphatase PhoE